MSEHETNEIATDELAWDEATVEEGRRPGAVVSVRLDPDETAKLRTLADSLGLNLSQVIRRALDTYEPTGDHEVASPERFYVAAFTYGGAVPVIHQQGFRWRVTQQMAFSPEEQSRSGDPVPTWTEPTRIVERVIV